MKLVYKNVGHVLQLGGGSVAELVVENKKLFCQMVGDLFTQAEGLSGGFVLSLSDKPIEISKNIDVIVQFSPFQLNKKSLLTKLHSALEQNAMKSENYLKTGELLSSLEAFVTELAEDLPFEIRCQKVAIGPVLRALAPEVDEDEKSTLEKVFHYMEIVRELDRDRLFVMVNMRSYFSDEDMERFTESAVLHDFKTLLLESVSFPRLQNVKRYTVDEDLCEF